MNNDKLKKVVLKAIDGGWKFDCKPKLWSPHGDGMECDFSGINSEWSVWTRKDNQSSISVPHLETIIDPTFWKALGSEKGANWGNEYFHEEDGKTYWDYDMHCPQCEEAMEDIENGCSYCNYEGDDGEIVSWQSYGCAFFRINLEQGFDKAVDWLFKISKCKDDMQT